MNSTEIKSLPDNPIILKEIIADQIGKHEDHIKQKQVYINILEEQIRLLKDQLWGRKTEKIVPKKYDDGTVQMCLPMFNEAEFALNAEPEEKEEEITVPGYKRKKTGRKPLPDYLPRVEKIIDLDEKEKICGCGNEKTRFGEEISEKLDIIPAKVQVIKTIRPKYACNKCEGTEAEGGAVSIAPAPVQLLPKSMLSAGFVAYSIISKFNDGLPYYRQAKIFERVDADITRATLANATIKVNEICKPLFPLMHEDLISYPIIGMDETTVQVMKELGRANTTDSYMWVYKGGPPGKPIIIFNYRETRSGKFLLDYLKDFEGYIQSDGYCGYDALEHKPKITLVGCWAHARRKFHDVIKANKVGEKKQKGHGKSVTFIQLIKNLYDIEREARENKMDAGQIYKIRQERSIPILNEIKDLLYLIGPVVPPKSLLGKGVGYCLERWDKLMNYTKDGRLSIDNNMLENAIRPFAIGRKNWLFAGSPRGADASASMYSLIETAKANGIEPYSYLRYLFEKIPFAREKTDFRDLLPYNLTQEKINSFLAGI